MENKTSWAMQQAKITYISMALTLNKIKSPVRLYGLYGQNDQQ